MKFRRETAEKGLTLIPTSIYFSGHLVKVEIGVAKARRKYDKRANEQEKVHKREMDRKMKY
jgi:SsrA-binding protein